MRALPIVRETFAKPDICTPCGGKCCQNHPGAAFPQDFGDDPIAIKAKLLEAFRTNRWAIDSWDGNFNGVWDAKYVRPSTAGKECRWLDRTWGGRCTFLSPSGCGIFDTRPTGCRGLQPIEGEKCEVRYGSKRDAIEAWLPYQRILREILDQEP